MALDAKVGSFAASTAASGTQDVTGVGFQPVLIFFWTVGRVTAADAVGQADLFWSWGFSAGASDNIAVCSTSEDAVTSSNTTRRSWGPGGGDADGYCVFRNQLGDNATTEGAFALDSFLSDGFRLEIKDQWVAADRIHYLALGGTELSHTSTDIATTSGSNWTAGSGSGTTPKAHVMLITGAQSGFTNHGSDTQSMHHVGVATGTAEEWTMSAAHKDGEATSSGDSYGYNDETYAAHSPPDSLSRRGAHSSFGADQVTLSPNENASNVGTGHLLIGGADLNVKAGVFSTRTDTNDIPVTGLGFRPAAVLFVSVNQANATQDTAQTDAKMTIGAATSESERGCQAFNDKAGETTMEVTTCVEFDAVYAHVSGGAVDALMDVKSFDADGFTCVMDDVEASATQVGYLAFGPGATGHPVWTRNRVQHGPRLGHGWG